MINIPASAMGRALEQTRAGNSAEATRIIQAALANTAAPDAGAGVATAPKRFPRAGRPPLGEVIDGVLNASAQSRKPMTGLPSAFPDVPACATYERRNYACVHGRRDYTLFVPSPRDAPVRGLILMLHGCTQNADDFAIGTRMNLHGERENLLIVYPEQDRGANQLGCWNWFQPQDQVRGRGEPALLADLSVALATEFGLARNRIFAAGLSAGGAMAAILGATHGDLFAAIGVHSGLAPGAARDLPGAYAAMRTPRPVSAVAQDPVPTIVLHGGADQTVHPANAGGVLAAAIGSASGVKSEPGEHAACKVYRSDADRLLAESWTIAGLGHAWSGGSPSGSHTQNSGVDASAEIIRFFMAIAEEQ